MSNPVSIVQIGDLIQTKNDKSKQLQSGEYLQYGVLPIVDQGAKHICGYTNDLSKCYDKGLPVVVFGDHTLHTKFIDFNFAIGADGTQVLGPKSKECDTKYLYYLVSRAAELIGSEGYKRHFKILKEFDIEYIEPLPKQQKIATILSSVDDVIEKTRAQIDKLKDLKTGMMQELLTKGIGHTEFKDSPVGLVPAAWKILQLDQVAKLGSSKRILQSEYVEKGVPFYRSKEVIRRSKGLEIEKTLYISRERFYDLSSKFGAPKEGEILITAVGTIGTVYLVEDKEFYFKDGNLLWLRDIKPEISSVFLAKVMQSEKFQSDIDRVIGGSSQSALTIEKLEQLCIPLPSQEEQLRIVNVLLSMDKKYSVATEKLSAMLRLKKALMQDLLTGKVRANLTDKESAVV